MIASLDVEAACGLAAGLAVVQVGVAVATVPVLLLVPARVAPGGVMVSVGFPKASNSSNSIVGSAPWLMVGLCCTTRGMNA